MKKFLCYYELHVADGTYYIHVIVEGKDPSDALNKLDSKAHTGKTYHLQTKGCLGLFTKKRAEKYLALSEVTGE